MRRSHRTAQRPLFDLDRPLGNAWSWVVMYQVASSGYVTEAHVTATRTAGDDTLCGIACCSVLVHDDLREVLECLATESMLAACEPTLDGSIPRRRIVYSSTF